MDDVTTPPEGPAPVQDDAAPEQPIDPSLNAGREAFGDVSDFGIQAEPDAPLADDRGAASPGETGHGG